MKDNTKAGDEVIFLYEMCPHCMDQLIERKQPIEDEETVNFCPKCGKKLEIACYGGQKADDTVYQIILNDASVSDYMHRKNKFLAALMKMGGFSADEALEKYNTKDSVIFEGNVSSVYVHMHLLDRFTPSIHYTVVPPFPFERFRNPFDSICPVCGGETIYKTEEIEGSEDSVKDGLFCETCNDWIAYTTFSKSHYDKTVYHLRASLKGVESKVRKEVLEMLDDEMQDQEVTEDGLMVNGLARDIESLLGMLKTYDIDYEIDPPYPHKIIEFKKEWTEEDIQQLIAANPGLTITVEEMNAL